MFRVDMPITERQDIIRKFLGAKQPVVALLLAALDCERTMRRAIIALGTTPSKQLAIQLGKPNTDGTDGGTGVSAKKLYRASVHEYKRAWDVEVRKRVGGTGLDEVVEDWKGLAKAVKLRNELVHGEKATTGLGYATDRVESYMKATMRVHEFAAGQKVNLDKPLKPRKKASSR